MLCHFAANQDEKVQPDSQLRRLFTRFERNPTSGMTIERLELLSPAWQDLKRHSAEALVENVSRGFTHPKQTAVTARFSRQQQDKLHLTM